MGTEKYIEIVPIFRDGELVAMAQARRINEVEYEIFIKELAKETAAIPIPYQCYLNHLIFFTDVRATR